MRMFKLSENIKNIRGQLDEAELWRQLLSRDEKYLKPIQLADLKREIKVDGDLTGFSVGYAFDRVLVCTMRARDIFFMVRNFWPEEMNILNTSDEYFSLDQKLADMESFSRGFGNTEVYIHLLSKEFSGFVFDENSPPDAVENIDIFDAFAALRRFIGKGSIVGDELRGLYAFFQDQWLRTFENSLPMLDRSARRILQGSFRQYLANQGFYPWLNNPSYEDGLLVNYREKMFEFAQLSARRSEMNMRDLMDDIFSESDIDPELRAEIVAIIERLSDVLEQIGRIDQVYRSITDGNGQWGDGSMIGSTSPVNIIPAEEDDFSSCQRVLVAFAQGGTRKRYGLKDVLKSVRTHLIGCGDSRCQPNGPTQAVILVTDTWDPRIIKDSIEDFRAHMNSAVPKVFVGLLVNGNQVTIQSLV